MAYFGHFWTNFMHVVHKINFVIFLHKTCKLGIIAWFIRAIFLKTLKNKHNTLRAYFIMGTAAEGDTAE